MYIVFEDLNGMDIYETKPGDCVRIFDTIHKDQPFVEVGIKRDNEYIMICQLSDIEMARRIPICYLEALEKGARVFYLSEVYFGIKGISDETD